MRSTLAWDRISSPGPAALVIAGLVVGGLMAGGVVLSLKWTLASILGVAAALPLLLIRPARLYGLGLYLLLLQLEPRGKSIDKYFVDAGEYLGRYGLPPSAEATIQILPSDLVILVLLGAWLLGRKRDSENANPISRLGFFLMAFFGWATLSVVVKADVFFFAIGELLQQLKFVVVFFFSANALDSRRLLQGVAAILVTCIAVQSLITLGTFVFQSSGHPLSFLIEGSGYVSDFANRTFISEEAEFEGMRALGTFGNPVQTAIYLELLLPVAFAFVWLARDWRVVLACGFSFLLGCGALVATFSRAGLIGLTCGLAATTVLIYLRGHLSSKQVLIGAYVGISALLLASPLLYDYATTRPEMLEKRVPLMEKAAVMILRNPVLGVGLNNHTAAKKAMFQAEEPSEEKLPTHNHYLALGSEVGLVGLGLHLVFLLLVLREAWRHSQAQDPLVRGLAIGIFGAAIGLYVHLFADNFSGNAQRSMFYFYAGTLVALGRVQRTSERAA